MQVPRIILPIILILTAFSGPAWADSSLFGDVNATGEALDELNANLELPTIARGRAVQVRTDLIAGGSARLRLNLFDDATVDAVLEEIDRRPSGITWYGHLEGGVDGWAILTVEKGRLAGNIATLSEVYQVRPLSGSVHAVYEIRQDEFAECAEPIEVEPPAGEEPLPAQTADDGSTIDVLVVYTAAAAAQSGDIAAEIQLAVDETNDSYAASGITQRIRLVHAALVDYEETGEFATDVARLRAKNDGYLDEVHQLRDDYCADLVNLWVSGGDACGIAYLMSTLGEYFEANAFSVVDRSCATGYYSFGHEMGHNMAARHDRYVDDVDTPFTHNHGFVSVANHWRTIMAYNRECTDAGTSCTRVRYWSTPDVELNGVPLGIADGDPDAADNALTLNRTASLVAGFRDSAVCEASPLVLVSFEGQAIEDYAALLTWETGSERDVAGFHLLRADTADGEYARITTSPLPAAGDEDSGAVYSYQDDTVTPGTVTEETAPYFDSIGALDATAGRTYYYKLDAVDSTGQSTLFGPVSVTIEASGEPEDPSFGCGVIGSGGAGLEILIAFTGIYLIVRRRWRA